MSNVNDYFFHVLIPEVDCISYDKCNIILTIYVLVKQNMKYKSLR